MFRSKSAVLCTWPNLLSLFNRGQVKFIIIWTSTAWYNVNLASSSITCTWTQTNTYKHKPYINYAHIMHILHDILQGSKTQLEKKVHGNARGHLWNRLRFGCYHQLLLYIITVISVSAGAHLGTLLVLSQKVVISSHTWALNIKVVAECWVSHAAKLLEMLSYKRKVKLKAYSNALLVRPERNQRFILKILSGIITFLGPRNV